MAPTGTAYNTDWVWSNNANVHVANHKDWFISLTDFKSQAGSIYFGPGSGPKVLGVGDVELNVKTHHSRSGSKKIILRNVLYCPDCVCNILGNGILNDYGLETDYGTMRGKLTERSTGANAAILDDPHFFRLRLVGYNERQTSFDKNKHYMINATWPDEEWTRWRQHKARIAPRQLSPLSDAEKTWLKKYWGSEYKFLIARGLHIAKDEHCEEGRDIMRAMMAGESEEDEEDEEEENSFLADLEADPSSHLADYHFGEAELEWVEKHYRHTGNFLRCYGLKPWNDEDCEEAVQISKSLMSPSDE